MKLKLTIIMLLVLLPITVAYTEIQWSTDNVTFYALTNTSNTTIIIEGLDNGINESTQYCFRLRNVFDTGNSDWVYICQTTNTSGDIAMNDLAIIVLLVAFGILLIAIGVTHLWRRDHYED